MHRQGAILNLSGPRSPGVSISEPLMPKPLEPQFSSRFSYLSGLSATAHAAVRGGWSVYAGWNPPVFLGKSRILKKSRKYAIDIKVQRFDYAPSSMRRWEEHRRLCDDQHGSARHAAASGVDTTASLRGLFERPMTPFGAQWRDAARRCRARALLLVEKTVSQYLFERAFVDQRDGIEDQSSEAHQHVRLRHCGSVNQRHFADGGDDMEAARVTDCEDKGRRPLFQFVQIAGNVDLLVVRTECLTAQTGPAKSLRKPRRRRVV